MLINLMKCKVKTPKDASPFSFQGKNNTLTLEMLTLKSLNKLIS